MDEPTPKDIAAGRSASYWFLSGFFLTRPDGSSLAGLEERLAAGAPPVEGAAEADVAPIREALAEPEREKLCERLAIEYTRLFRGIREGYGPPPPFESLYRGARLEGEVTASVVEAYAEAGFGTIDESAGPQDHLGVELKFLSLLCHEEMAAWERDDPEEAANCRRLEAAFLDRHLLRWLPAYCDRIARESREPFFAAVARLVQRAVAADRELLRPFEGK